MRSCTRYDPALLPDEWPGDADPPASEYERRLAGLKAHNRWLSDWCAELPGRRAGIGQILLNNVDDAVREVNWIADHGLMGGALLPGYRPAAASILYTHRRTIQCGEPVRSEGSSSTYTGAVDRRAKGTFRRRW